MVVVTCLKEIAIVLKINDMEQPTSIIAYHQGEWSYLQGDNVDTCPYQNGTEEYLYWNHGWNSAKGDNRERIKEISLTCC